MRLRLLAMALLVAACGGIPVMPPTHTLVLLEQSSFGRFVLLIYDQTELLASAATGGAEESATTDARAIAHPETSQIELSWMGGACAHGPKLALSGDTSALLLELDISPLEPSAVPVSCPAVGIVFRVTLTLSAPVTQDALTLKLLSQ